MNSACDQSEDPSERCGYHHPTEQTNSLGSKNCCCGTPWQASQDRCASGAVEGEADKTYLEWLKLQVRSLQNDLNALKARSDTETR